MPAKRTRESDAEKLARLKRELDAACAREKRLRAPYEAAGSRWSTALRARMAVENALERLRAKLHRAAARAAR